MGTWQLKSEQAASAVNAAIDAGYRSIDTARVYNNESAIGSCLQELFKSGKIKREDLFITSKLSSREHGYENAKKSVLKSLEDLRLDYIDLYLVHFPGGNGLDTSDPQNAVNRKESWRGLEEMTRNGNLRAIGVSNYMANHLREMKEYAEILPVVDQIELSPVLVPEDCLAVCSEMGIAVESYSTLGTGLLLSEDFLSKHRFLKEIATRHERSVAQIILRWAFQKGFIVIPKSKTPERVKENIQIFDFSLSGEEMELINKLKSENVRTCWDPTVVK